MRVHVVGSILRVVLEDENRRVGPEFRFTHGFDDAAEGLIIFSDHRRRGGFAGHRAHRMVVPETEHLQARHAAFALEAADLRGEPLGTLGIGIVHVPRAIERVDVADENRQRRRGQVRAGFRRGAIFAVAAVAHAGLGRTVPKIAVGGRRDRESPLGGVVVFFLRVVPVAQRPVAFDEVRRIGTHAPLVAIGAHLTIGVEIVEQHKFAGERVGVGRDLFRKDTQPRITFALEHVAENLVVGPIFPDDVDHIFNRRRIADRGRDRAAGGPSRQTARRRSGIEGAARVGCLRPGTELLGAFFRHRQGDQGDRALKESTNVFLQIAGRRRPGKRAARIGRGARALAVGDEERLAIR